MIVLIRGGGDLASGVAVRLYRAGLRVVMTELPQPLAVRRTVSFSEAILAGEVTVEGIRARRVTDASDSLRVLQILSKGSIPVLIDPEAVSAQALHPTVIVDGRMRKKPPEPLRHTARLFIGLGPGFEAPKDCHVVIETNRGHTLGRVIWQGTSSPDTGVPEGVLDYRAERVLRAPADGTLMTFVNIGDHLDESQLIAEVAGKPVTAPFPGTLRGLLPDKLVVQAGVKIGDLDPRDDPSLCTLVSEKSLAVGGGVLEAILSRSELRSHFWE